jgi:hypothetical protein
MLGRFCCPASCVAELAGTLPDDLSDLRVSVVLDRAAAAADPRGWDTRVAEDLRAAAGVGAATAGRARVELVEVRLPGAMGPDTVERDVFALQAAVADAGLVGARSFAEVPLAPGWQHDVPLALAAIAAVRAQAGGADPAMVGARRGGDARPGAKLRCGGLTADAFPTPAQVACFVAGAAANGVPFKVTAGLHHALRHRDLATGVVHHGFLNVVGAAVLAHALALDEETLAELVSETRAEAFSLTAEGFGWRDLRADPAAVAAARRELVVAYGSCSFSEPVDDLRDLGVLPATTPA